MTRSKKTTTQLRRSKKLSIKSTSTFEYVTKRSNKQDSHVTNAPHSSNSTRQLLLTITLQPSDCAMESTLITTISKRIAKNKSTKLQETNDDGNEEQKNMLLFVFVCICSFLSSIHEKANCIAIFGRDVRTRLELPFLRCLGHLSST